MTRNVMKRYRLARRVALILAAAPLFQLQQCGTGFSQVLQTVANNLPATYFSVLNNLVLLPIQLLLGGGIFGGAGGAAV